MESHSLVYNSLSPASPSSESPPKSATRCVNLCIMAHGLMGNKHDWDVWMDLLQERFPDWILWPLASLAVNKGTSFMGDSVKASADKAAAEMLIAIRSQLLCGASQVVVHCIGHSMGGLILRGALPRILDDLAESEIMQVQFGHYMSLSSPQLGVQAGWAVPWLWWRNLSKYTGRFSGQLTQLAMNDGKQHGLPYLAALADKDGKYIAALSKFKCRTCVSMTTGDPLIPTCSGLIQNENPFNKSFLQSGFKGTWRFEAREGTDPQSAFEQYLQSNLVSKVPPPDAGFALAASERIAGSALGLTPFMRDVDSGDRFHLSFVSSMSLQDEEDRARKSTMESSVGSDTYDIDEECDAVDADEPSPQKPSHSVPRRAFASDACSKSCAGADEGEDDLSRSTTASTGRASDRDDQDAVSRQRGKSAIDESLVKRWLKQKGYKDINVPKVMRKNRTKFPIHSAVKDNDAEMVWLLLNSGANVDAQNSENQTAFEVAEKLQSNGSHSQVLDLLANAERPFECKPSTVCSVPLSWLTSADGAVRFPQEALDGLCSVPWQRIPVTASLLFKNMHVFLMAKKSEQRSLENRLSRECLRCLVEILAD